MRAANCRRFLLDSLAGPSDTLRIARRCEYQMNGNLYCYPTFAARDPVTLAESATGLQQSSGDPTCILRRKEGDNGGDVLRCTRTAKWGVLDGIGLKI
jgi:hypothetical protein